MRHHYNPYARQERRGIERVKLLFELQQEGLAQNPSDEHTRGYLQAMAEMGHCLWGEISVLRTNEELHTLFNQLANISSKASLLLLTAK